MPHLLPARPSMCPNHLPLLLALLAITPLSGAEPVDYQQQIKPLLSEKCYSCHGALKQESGLRLETRAMMIAGDVIVPGDLLASELYQRVTSDGQDRMPPAEDGAALLPDQLELLKRWIQAGADAPDEAPPPSPTEHWAFQPITRPMLVPSSNLPGVAQHPIDAWLAIKQMEFGTTPLGQADRPLLLRRLYLDLIGMPPTSKQLRDDRPWEQIVNDLLARPEHGERWARHWMDVWRYSDWYGLGEQIRNSQKHIWHWRDWIVRSLNDDKGYDQMIMQMLAGDELAPDDSDAVAATGYLARSYYLFNRTTWLDETIEHTGKAFLGLTLNCSKCHDHKYDPISQLDYYRFRAIFEPHQVRLDPIAGVTDFEQDGLPRVFDDAIDLPTFLHERGDPMKPDKEHPLSPGVPAILASFAPAIEPVTLPHAAFAPGTRSYVQQDAIRQAELEIVAAEQELRSLNSVQSPAGDKQSSATEGTGPAIETVALRLAAAQANLRSLQATIDADQAHYVSLATPDSCLLLARDAARLQQETRVAEASYRAARDAADANKVKSAEQEKVAAEKILAELAEGGSQYDSPVYKPLSGSKKALETPEHNHDNYPAVFNRTSSGRRLALARWMVDKQNPLTARVAVNQVWMRHFGTPLVDTVFDFGLRTSRPLHAELLDYLAVEWIESGWSFKHLHRLIVTSEAYQRQSSQRNADQQTLAVDPNNFSYWRANSKRMESQLVRDSLLVLGQCLDPSRGGPSVDPRPESRRRSLYLKHSRDQQDKLLAMFDDADILQCYRRSESIVPQQALALSNSKLAIEMSSQIAVQLSDQLMSDSWPEFIDEAFFVSLGRKVTDEEQVECERFIESLSQLPEVMALDPPQRQSLLQSRLVQVLINHNDFVTIR